MDEFLEGRIKMDVQRQMAEQIRHYAKERGLEGVEDSLRRVYAPNSEILSQYLEVYQMVVRKEI